MKLDRASRSMRSTAIWLLSALNMVLLVALIWRPLGASPAMAQAGRPGDYLMIPGEALGASSAIVYVLDQSSHMLGAMSYDDGNRRLDTMPPLSLDRVFSEAGGPAGNTPPRRPAR